MTVKLMLSHDTLTEDVLEQLQKFLMDAYKIDEPNWPEEEPSWCPLDADVVTVDLEEDQVIYIEEEETKQDPIQYLDWGES